MSRNTVSRTAFRGLFAFYAAKARHDHKHDGELCLAKLFKSSDDISDRLLDDWSECVRTLDPGTVGDVLCPSARAVVDGTAHYDHASDFLHALLRELHRPQH